VAKKLSIITVCRNIKDTIQRTCESIINQTWQDFEWIVVDGGSTDGTVEILKRYKDRIDILISEPDNGIYNAMNKGIKIATGEYLNFMNGGDSFYDNGVLEKVFKNKEYSADILYGWQYFKVENNFRKFTEQLTKEKLCSTGIGHQAEFIKK
jgi:glycosyltransferase involved in cell wall biosynthesis